MTKKKAPAPPAKSKQVATKKAKPVVTAKKAPEPEVEAKPGPGPDVVELVDFTKPMQIFPPITPVQAGYSDADHALLLVGEANKKPEGYDFCPSDLLAMLDPLHVETNYSMRGIDSNGNHGIAARLTPSGLQRAKEILEVRAAQLTPPASFMTQTVKPASTITEVKETMNQTKFAIEDVPMPEVLKLKRIVTPRYPFGALNVGQSFFVPSTEERPNAVKSMTGNVANANRKFKPARFRMVPEPSGVRVFRTE